MDDRQHTDLERQLHVALDNMPGALAFTDVDLRIVFCNDRFKEMYKVPQELLQPGRPVTNLAARLFGEANDGQILISPRVFSKTEERIEAEPVGELSLKGFQRPVVAHNVVRLRA